MGSRRTTTRSSFGNGRSSNGNDVSGSSRSSGCNYLSNVRPENRSTLCSVMAQLTEETQPSFVTTLKSKAVSESCNVKFSCVVTGYPVPQITWYKDDKQLDRYCGLPKYEIFRNGENHSLHIYNCTVEDAAIYQASAINSKGIVSCSGVLEVGEMNEFKIHQSYFAKLKQKSEGRRMETEGKENQEPLRTISPDRTQRKRRSTMEAFLSTPGSIEEDNEEIHRSPGLVTGSGLQEAAVEEAEKKPVSVTNGAVSIMTNGQTDNDEDSKRGKNIYDPAHKMFTTHQPKSPFVKKKIKISSGIKAAKADLMGGRVSNEKRAKDETSPFGAPACTEAAQSNGNPEEVMEMENKVYSSAVDSVSRNIKEEHHNSTAGEEMLAESPSKDDKICVIVSGSSQRHFTSSVPTIANLSVHPVSGAEVEKAAKHKKESVCKDPEEILKMQNQKISTQKQSSVSSSLLNIMKENRDERAPIMDINVESKTSADGCISHSSSESVDTPCDIRTGLPQRPCELSGNELSEKETSPCQKKESRSAVPSEVTQAHIKMNRNDAFVNPEPPPDRCTIDSQMRQRTDEIQTSSSCGSFQGATDEMTQDTQDNSKESNESCSVLFTNPQRSPLKSPGGGGEDTPGYNVSPPGLQSQADTAIKTIEGTEIQDVEKVEGYEEDKLVVQADRVAPGKNIDEMETETAGLHLTQSTRTETIKEAGNKHSVLSTKDTSYTETKKNESTSTVVEKTSSELQKLKSDTAEPALPLPTKTPASTDLEESMPGFKEIPKPVTEVISIAELLRSQLKALESTIANSVSSKPIHADLAQDPVKTATAVCQELRDDNIKGAQEVKPGRRTSRSPDDEPPTNIKENLTKVYSEPNKTEQKQIPNTDATSAPVQVLEKTNISLRETGKALDSNGLNGNAKKYNVAADISQGTLSSKDFPVVASPSGIKNAENSPSLALKEKCTNRHQSVLNLPENVCQESESPLTVTHMKAGIQETAKAKVWKNAHNEPVQDCSMEMPPAAKHMSKMEKAVTEVNMTTVSGEHEIEELSKNKVSFQREQKHPKQEKNAHVIQQESSMVSESLRSDSFISPTPESSPLLKRGSNVSPIPSATPQELASGARRKILISKTKAEEVAEITSPTETQTESMSRRSPLLHPSGEINSPVARRSPLLARRKASDNQTVIQPLTDKVTAEEKPVEKDKHNQFKAPQVIRKIRGETFADASGHLKLWCQFFNVLSDSVIKWYKNEEEIAQVKRNAGDETQVNLAIVQASSKDSGVYGCSVTNQYGTDSTDFLLSADILAGMFLREDLGVGEEIEMTPMIFSKGLADSGTWGNKFFGRIMMAESHIGEGCSHKVWRAKVIYGLEPVFESGNTCIIKARSPVTFGGKEDSCLIEKNLEMMKQECKIQNLAREYCKIFTAEARVLENFGPTLEVIPVYLMYRPGNVVPYTTVETDLTGVYHSYCALDHAGRMDMKTGSEVEQKCSALQHWIFQWTNGNLLLTRLEGVDTKITNVGISVKSTGHQGLSVEGNPKVFEQFVSQHKCNYFCGLLSLRSLKVMDSLMTPSKPKGSKSPLLQRKMAAGSSSPQSIRKAAGSPMLSRKAERDGSMTPTKLKASDAPKVV